MLGTGGVNEKNLWNAVLLRAVRDARGDAGYEEAVKARRWLTSPNYVEDRRIVCELAGQNVETVARWVANNLRPLEEIFG